MTLNSHSSRIVFARLRDHLHERGMDVLRKIRVADRDHNSILTEQLAAEFRALDEEWERLKWNKVERSPTI
jgi:hypothetical protein